MKDTIEDSDTYVTETKYNRETGLPVFQQTRLNGLLQSPPDGSASEVIFDEAGRPLTFTWHDQDLPHREGSGAYIKVNSENGIHVSEFFFTKGWHRTREDGPYWIVRDPETGLIVKQEFKDDPKFPKQESAPSLDP